MKSTDYVTPAIHFLIDQLAMIQSGPYGWQRLLNAVGRDAKIIDTLGLSQPYPIWWGDIQEISFASWDKNTLILVGTCKVLVSPVRQRTHLFFATITGADTHLPVVGSCVVGDDFDDLSQHFTKEVEEALCLAGLLGSPQMGTVPVVLEQF